MGKAGKWLRSCLTGKKEKGKESKNGSNLEISASNGEEHHCPTTPISIPQPATPKEKRQWGFRLSSAAASGRQNFNSVENMPTSSADYMENDDSKKHALAVAAATAAAADAAVASAKAAAAVIRLTAAAASGRAGGVEESAATKIQSVFRAYLARKALHALKGLVKFQALVRGHLVRKRATAALGCMEAMMKVKAQVRAQRLQVAEETKFTAQRQLVPRKSTHENKEKVLSVLRKFDEKEDTYKGAYLYDPIKGKSRKKSPSNPLYGGTGSAHEDDTDVEGKLFKPRKGKSKKKSPYGGSRNAHEDDTDVKGKSFKQHKMQRSNPLSGSRSAHGDDTDVEGKAFRPHKGWPLFDWADGKNDYAWLLTDSDMDDGGVEGKLFERSKGNSDKEISLYDQPHRVDDNDTGAECRLSEWSKSAIHFGVREDNIVGFDDEAQTIINFLIEEKEELDAVSIIGVPGLGKTTLARKIFHNPKIICEFPTCIWVNVSQEVSKKDVFLAILSNFTNIEDKRQQTDHEIAQTLRMYLEAVKFLIVMDDVWTTKAWIDLQDALPKFNKTGRILITSRSEEVARQVNRNKDPHKLRLLTAEEGWKLLQLEVFGKEWSLDDLTAFGKIIVDRCGGLPLAIVMIGGILAEEASFGDIEAMKIAWRKVSESAPMYLNDEKRMENIISWSYNKLPCYLRPCFLYLGMFPEDIEIPVWKLIRMWIAEEFIQEEMGPKSLEQIAQDYLEDLILRNLVMVEKVSPDGKIKTCRIHDTLREFCRNEAGKEKFFQEMKKPGGGAFEPAISEIEKFHRLCIHSNIMSFISSKPYGPHIQSFLCFSKEEITLQRENISFIPEAFKIIRVLEATSFNFQRLPSDLMELVQIRYLSLSSNFKVLPKAISKLLNLQTLIVYTSSRILDIKADIWNMSELRHVKTNASAILPKPSKSIEECKKLQTLGTVSHRSCTEDVFNMIRALRKLGIRGQLATLSYAKGFENLDNLEKLKLENEIYPGPAYEGQLLTLPEPYEFPAKLRSLTLSATFLDWQNISTLGMLDTLEVLKLKNNAFTGEYWEATDGGFRHLEVLHIERTDLVTWAASSHHFPRLRCLVLRSCEKLKEIPSGLGENLQKLDMRRVNKSVVASAREIQKVKNEQQEKNGSIRGGFKLILSRIDEL